MPGKKETRKVPQAAMHLMDHGCFAQAEGGGEDGAKKKLKMVMYSGGIIKGHWYWGNLAIDLEGMTFPKSKFPVLENHETSRKIGFSKGKPVIENSQLMLDSDKFEFVSTEFADEFMRLSSEGFPYESSIYATPLAIERLERGTHAMVNGKKVSGPATVWRQTTFKEASVCVFGWDSNTRSAAFGSAEMDMDLEVTELKLENNPANSQEKEVTEKMKLDELKKDHQELYQEIVDATTAEVTTNLETKFTQEKKDLKATFAQEKEGFTDRMLELEKKDTIRTEKENQDKGAKIWENKLADSDIPDHLHEKVSQHVSVTKFVKDGVFDEVKFTEKVDAEIKDWEDRGVSKSTVLGLGTSEKDVEGQTETKLAKENDDVAKDLLSMAGQATE